ncbi:MAG TPA: hypothetical protein VLR71_13770 [Casimicrobiaceae bacterium]|nr:hypothetical protein [Casimicrobiaceae bacterium]
MPLAGTAFLALWNDIRRAREPEYDQWHTLEHVPERVAVDGFLGARRYVNRAREQHRYFTLYDVAALAVFDSAAYHDLLDRPTPWSAAMRPDFENFVRAVCAVEASAGTGIGAAIAALCVESVDDDTLRSALDAAATLPRINAVHLGARRDSGPGPGVGAARNDATPRAFNRIALIEALDHAAADDALVRVRHALDLRAMPRDFGCDVYDLAFVFPGHDAGERDAHRRLA